MRERKDTPVKKDTLDRIIKEFLNDSELDTSKRPIGNKFVDLAMVSRIMRGTVVGNRGLLPQELIKFNIVTSAPAKYIVEEEVIPTQMVNLRRGKIYFPRLSVPGTPYTDEVPDMFFYDEYGKPLLYDEVSRRDKIEVVGEMSKYTFLQQYMIEYYNKVFAPITDATDDIGKFMYGFVNHMIYNRWKVIEVLDSDYGLLESILERSDIEKEAIIRYIINEFDMSDYAPSRKDKAEDDMSPPTGRLKRLSNWLQRITGYYEDPDKLFVTADELKRLAELPVEASGRVGEVGPPMLSCDNCKKLVPILDESVATDEYMLECRPIDGSICNVPLKADHDGKMFMEGVARVCSTCVSTDGSVRDYMDKHMTPGYWYPEGSTFERVSTADALGSLRGNPPYQVYHPNCSRWSR